MLLLLPPKVELHPGSNSPPVTTEPCGLHSHVARTAALGLTPSCVSCVPGKLVHVSDRTPETSMPGELIGPGACTPNKNEGAARTRGEASCHSVQQHLYICSPALR